MLPADLTKPVLPTVNKSANYSEQLFQEQLLTACSPAATSLLTELFTDDAVLTFAWAWWRMGCREQRTGSDLLRPLMMDPNPSPLEELCRVAYSVGMNNLSWQRFLGKVKTYLGQRAGLTPGEAAPLGLASDATAASQPATTPPRRD